MLYLENNLCKFTPLFDIDYNKKTNFLSTCFFKMINRGYKDFSKYLDGLIELSNTIFKLKINYKIRLFIDDNIYSDKEIYNKILKLKNVQMVLYSCPNFIVKDKYHIGLFGTMLRFFPFFDFPNNDANIVVAADIDGTNISIITKYLRILKEKESQIFDNIYLLKYGPLNRSLRYRYNFIYNNKFNPYIYASSYASIKRIDRNIIIDYLEKVNKSKENLNLSYHIMVTKNMDSEENITKYKSHGNFIYGVDEYFLNDVLSKYIIDNNLCYAVSTKWDVFGCLYYVLLLEDMLTEKEVKLIDCIFDYVSNSLDIKIDKNLDIQKKFNIIDKMNNSNEHKYKINRIFYKIFLYLRSNSNYKFLYPNGFYDIFADNQYFGIYDIDLIKIINYDKKDKEKDKDIVVNQSKLNDKDLNNLKIFYEKYKNI